MYDAVGINFFISLAEVDFSGCLKKAIERRMNCTIPDWNEAVKSGNTSASPDECAGEDEFKMFVDFYADIEKSSEPEIHQKTGCMPKCNVGERS